MNNHVSLLSTTVMLVLVLLSGASGQVPLADPSGYSQSHAPPQDVRVQDRSTYSQPSSPVPGAVSSPQVPAAAAGGVDTSDRNPTSPQAPFQLTPAEETFRDQVLQMWETESTKVITFKSTFDRWEYSEYGRGYIPEGPGYPERRNTEVPWIKSRGQLAYAKPDKGSFKIDEIFRYQWDGTNQRDIWPKVENEIGERWVCDGKFVYNYNHQESQLEVSAIPPELQGKAIVDGPLPFLFGAKAEKLKERYWIRVTQSAGDEIWLDTYPKYQADAASYRRVELILDKKDLIPKAMQVYMPNGDRTVYMFDQPTVNSQLDRLFGIFKPPRTPFGWKRIMLDAPRPSNPSASQQQARVQPMRQPTLPARY